MGEKMLEQKLINISEFKVFTCLLENLEKQNVATEEIFDQIKEKFSVSMIQSLVNHDIQNYIKNPYYNYNKLSNEYLIYRSERYRLSLQIREKQELLKAECQYSSIFSYGVKCLFGTVNLVQYNIEKSEGKVSKIVTKGEINLRGGESVFLPKSEGTIELKTDDDIVCLLVFNENCMDDQSYSFDAKTKNFLNSYSTNVQASRIRIYMDFIASQKNLKAIPVINKLLDESLDDALKWSLTKNLFELSRDLGIKKVKEFINGENQNLRNKSQKVIEKLNIG